MNVVKQTELILLSTVSMWFHLFYRRESKAVYGSYLCEQLAFRDMNGSVGEELGIPFTDLSHECQISKL